MSIRKRDTTARTLSDSQAKVLWEKSQRVQELKVLRAKVDELGDLTARLAPHLQTIVDYESAKAKVKDLMVKLDLTEAEGKHFVADREAKPFRFLDNALLEAKLGDLEPYKKNGLRQYITLKAKVKRRN